MLNTSRFLRMSIVTRSDSHWDRKDVDGKSTVLCGTYARRRIWRLKGATGATRNVHPPVPIFARKRDARQRWSGTHRLVGLGSQPRR